MPAYYGGVAQLGEHLLCKQGVKSSNLSISTPQGGQVPKELRGAPSKARGAGSGAHAH